MKKRTWVMGGVVLAAIIIAVIALYLLPFGGQGQHATVVEAINQVDTHPRPADTWQPAAVDMAIYGGGQVRTGADSRARLELLEGIVRLSADTIFTVKESVTRRGRALTTLSLQEGRLWVSLTTSQPHEFTVETGNAVAAVRDTRFSVEVTAGETLVSVAEGKVVLTAQEQSVTVAAGQQTTVKADQPPAPPEPLSAEERTLWSTEGEMPEMAPPTSTPTQTPTPTRTPSATPAPSKTPAPSRTPTETATRTPIPTRAPIVTLAPMKTLPPSRSLNPMPTQTPSATPAPSETPTKSSGKPKPLHIIGGFLNLDAVDGENWPASSSVTIRVFSAPGGTLLFTGTASTSEEGHFYLDVGADLVPGMAVEVTDGTFTKDVTLVSLTVDVIDPATGTVSGTASAGSEVTVRSGTWSQSVTANDKGVWTANFTGSLDITKEGIQAETPDGDGDRTVVKI